MERWACRQGNRLLMMPRAASSLPAQETTECRQSLAIMPILDNRGSLSLDLYHRTYPIYCPRLFNIRDRLEGWGFQKRVHLINGCVCNNNFKPNSTSSSVPSSVTLRDTLRCARRGRSLRGAAPNSRGRRSTLPNTTKPSRIEPHN